MKFSKSELEIINQYAAPTKAETLTGRKLKNSPLKEGATIHHLPVVRCALPGASCGKRMISSMG